MTRKLSFRFNFKVGFRTGGITLSPIKDFQEKAEKAGAISLAQGVPKFSIPSGVWEAAISAIRRGLVDSYGPYRGIAPLRKEIAAWHLAEEGVSYDPHSEVLVTGGALQAMTATFLALLPIDSELIIPTPAYFPFLHLPKVCGIRPVSVPLQGGGWRPEISKIRKAITPQTGGILLTNPNNPTGTVYREEELEEILRLTEKYDLLVFVDEAYRYCVYEDRYTSLGRFERYRERIIRVMSFSKAFALSGWRVGYLLAPPSVVAEIAKVYDMMATASASLPAQYAALAALSDFPDLPVTFAKILRKRRALMSSRLRKLSPFLVSEEPAGAYYFFARILNELDDLTFTERLLEEVGVAVVPGSAFGEEGRGFVRLSFGAEEEEIKEAFDRLERYFKIED